MSNSCPNISVIIKKILYKSGKFVITLSKSSPPVLNILKLWLKYISFDYFGYSCKFSGIFPAVAVRNGVQWSIS